MVVESKMDSSEEEEEEPYLFYVKCMFVQCPTYLHLYPCTLPTAPVSKSFGLRSSYEIDILALVDPPVLRLFPQTGRPQKKSDHQTPSTCG